MKKECNFCNQTEAIYNVITSSNLSMVFLSNLDGLTIVRLENSNGKLVDYCANFKYCPVCGRKFDGTYVINDEFKSNYTMNTERLKQILKEKKLSMNRLSKESGIPEATVRRIITKEDANPTIKQVKSIAKALGVKIDEIV